MFKVAIGLSWLEPSEEQNQTECPGKWEEGIDAEITHAQNIRGPSKGQTSILNEYKRMYVLLMQEDRCSNTDLI